MAGPVLFVCASLLLLSGASAQTADGSPIKLGMSTALGGPAGHLGTNMRDGIEVALAEANGGGGVQGRELKLVALDDGYEPERTVPNMWQLINEENVLAIVGNVGTPTAVSAIPLGMGVGRDWPCGCRLCCRYLRTDRSQCHQRAHRVR